jgi:hypothetical protein
VVQQDTKYMLWIPCEGQEWEQRRGQVGGPLVVLEDGRLVTLQLLLIEDRGGVNGDLLTPGRGSSRLN